jgi:hypothetical protein
MRLLECAHADNHAQAPLQMLMDSGQCVVLIQAEKAHLHDVAG